MSVSIRAATRASFRRGRGGGEVCFRRAQITVQDSRWKCDGKRVSAVDEREKFPRATREEGSVKKMNDLQALTKSCQRIQQMRARERGVLANGEAEAGGGRQSGGWSAA